LKIRPVGAELYHAGRRTDRQTDITKLIVAFRNFANEPKICELFPQKVFMCSIFLLTINILFSYAAFTDWESALPSL